MDENPENEMILDLDLQLALDAKRCTVPDHDTLVRWVRAALRGRKKQAQLVVRIVDLDESAKLNITYRNGSGPTNVLSFPFEKPELLDPPLLGDIVICAPLVEEEAREQHKAPMAHWAHLVIHGVLHLLGYDHGDERQAQIMEGLEKLILADFGFIDPYLEARPEAVNNTG